MPSSSLSPSFWEAFKFWLKLGFISFGGPAGQIAIMHQELVERRRWVSEPQFLHALNFCMVLPGPEAQQLATYLGWILHRTWGGIVAGTLFILPSFFILIALAWIYLRFGHLTVVEGIFYGIKPAVVAIIVHACWRIGRRTITHRLLLAIALAAFTAIYVFNIAFPYIILCAALIGGLSAKRWPHIFHSSAHGAHTPSPSTTPTTNLSTSWSQMVLAPLKTLSIGVLLWAAPMALLIVSLGWQHIYTQMAWFFTKAALLTFGGAYAVLPYVHQAAVEQYAWLSATQMMDGLALGETTPGPLIMVVTFVGFVAAYLTEIQHPMLALWSGFIGASVVTWFTFLPSFLFIFAGAPLIEKTHGQLKITGPLTAITAAIVGVIFYLALFFAEHSFKLKAATQANAAMAISWDFFAIALSALAMVLLFRFKWGVIQLIGLCAVCGFLYRMIMA